MNRRTLLRAGALAVLAPAAAACGVTRNSDTGSTGPLTGLRMIVGNSPGSGYDITARTVGKAMTDSRAARGLEVFNVAGAGGTIGLARLVNSRGSEDMLMMMGLGVVGAVWTNQSSATLEDTTPLARLIEDPSAIVVPRDSPFTTFEDLAEVWRRDPGALNVGGGSSPGGPDHLLPMQVAESLGIDPRRVSYIGYDGGGELLTALLGAKVDVAATGIGEMVDQVTGGDVRILAVTGDTGIDAVRAPTLAELGSDVAAINWRGVVAAPGISEERRRRLVQALATMRESAEWRDALGRNGWSDAYLPGDDFRDFLRDQDRRVADTLRTLGLAS
ncbi:tripartite tricarboxylate transporter substrate binding protein [Allostreptomyces psammosilenae]|uniref:Putative tricarboxylic transport membrane protein n=1 Tax=Allostreptomyces psammosilenae TaxID=1892865 RepID=A0A852ZPE2_9ACTN|nr:tripartite tricarboxylate transporter substrate binding protein [Allostreptomyces psammosilenae]NYI04229.1 putative tricarboxylic transport membrane protein [Allostreptomyces psammosilenae]